jgi:methylsterol monooxygenase
MLIIAVYWIFGGIYTLLDITNKPAVLRKYKIQPGTNEPVDPKRLMEASTEYLLLKHVYFNPVAMPIEIFTAYLIHVI